MKIKFYEDIKEFVKENEKLILEKEWLNNLMVGNYKDGLENGADGWLLAKVENEGKTELIMLLRRPWHLLLYSPTNNKSDELYKFTAKEIYKVDNDIPGVLAEKEIANKFAKYYTEISSCEYKLRTPMRILLLENLAEEKLNSKVIYRRAKPEDKDALIKFIIDFNEEALHKKYSYEEAEEKYNGYLEKGYYVLEHNGKVVSQAVLSRKLEKGKCVSGVYTPKEERGKGYAYNLVYRVSKEQLDNGAEFCVLFTDDENPISNHIYEKIGYERKADIEDLDFIFGDGAKK
mgnify:CR=1 FL=1